MTPKPSSRSSVNATTVAYHSWYMASWLVTGAIVLTLCGLPFGPAVWAQSPLINSSFPASTSAPASGPSPASPVGEAFDIVPKEEPKAASAPPSISHQADAVPTSVRAEAARLGPDPARLLAWVASEIGQEVYPGVMLGAAGTLSAKAGNASDKALLLHGLLRASEAASELRFATCTLQAEQADQIVDAALAYRPAPPTLLLEVANDVAQHTQEPDVRQLLERGGKSWQALVEEARAESDQLAKALAAVGIKLGAPALARDKLRPIASRHVWLQRRQGNEWTDLDPSLKDAVPGLSRCKAESVTPELLPEQYHHLTVKVKVEERHNGSLQTHYVLEKSWPVADLASTPLTLLYAEPHGLSKLVPSGTAAPEGTQSYTPVLQEGDRYEVGQPFFLPQPASAPRGSSMESVGQAFGGLGKALEGLGAKAKNPAKAPAQPQVPEVSAAWLALTISAPDGHQETIESPIFDRIGYAARAAKSGVPATLAQLPEADGEYLPLVTVWNIALWTSAAAPRPGAEGIAGWSEDSIGLAKLLGQLHLSYYNLRHALFNKIQPPSAARIVSTRPGVSLIGWMPTVAHDGGGELVMDLVSDPSQSLVSFDPTSPSQALAWGVSSVLSERFLVNLNRLLSGDMPPPGANAVSVFSTARKEQVSLQLLKPGEGARVQSISASAEARARLEAHLVGGRTVLVPERAVSVGSAPVLGWWLVDADSGTVWDEMENGRHSPGTEYKAQTSNTLQSASGVRKLGVKITCWLNRAVFALSLLSGDPAATWKAFLAEKELIETIIKVRERAEQACDLNKPGIGAGR